MLHAGRTTAKVLVEFLKRLMQDAKRPIFLIVDGHPIHRAKLVRDCVLTQQGRLKLFLLPPYSPHLSPDEQVWGNVKARVAKRAATTKDDLKAKVISGLRRVRKLRGII